MKHAKPKTPLLTKSGNAVLDDLLIGLNQIGKSVTARHYVDRLLACEGAKRFSNLAEVPPAVSPHTLRRIITDENIQASIQTHWPADSARIPEDTRPDPTRDPSE